MLLMIALQAINYLGESPLSLCSGFSTQATVPSQPDGPVVAANTEVRTVALCFHMACCASTWHACIVLKIASQFFSRNMWRCMAPDTFFWLIQTSLTLSWTAPADNGSPISAYVLEADDGRGGDFHLAYAGINQTHTVTGLRSGLHYRFRLRADNDVSGHRNVVVLVIDCIDQHCPQLVRNKSIGMQWT